MDMFIICRLSLPLNYCDICGVVLPSILCQHEKHSNHHRALSADDLKFPSRWILPRDSNKTNAVSWLSANKVTYIDNILWPVVTVNLTHLHPPCSQFWSRGWDMMGADDLMYILSLSAILFCFGGEWDTSRYNKDRRIWQSSMHRCT